MMAVASGMHSLSKKPQEGIPERVTCMTDTDGRQHRLILQRIAHRAMLERGLVPDFPPEALAELDQIHGSATRTEESTRDLRNLLWCSIDNDDSRDLDQLTVAEAMTDGAAKVLVAIADVDAIVKKQSALDDHARQNTTSVYTVAETFPMLPEKLSMDLTSLNYASDRLAIVIEMVLAGDGSLQSSDLYGATVRLTKARGSVFCSCPLKEDWRAVLEAWTSATGSACNWSARIWSVGISTSCRARRDRQGTEICICTVRVGIYGQVDTPRRARFWEELGADAITLESFSSPKRGRSGPRPCRGNLHRHHFPQS
jgi:RNB domain